MSQYLWPSRGVQLVVTVDLKEPGVSQNTSGLTFPEEAQPVNTIKTVATNSAIRIMVQPSSSDGRFPCGTAINDDESRFLAG
jgi:hypothetical protein